VKLLGRRRPSEDAVTAAVTAATGVAPGEIAYNHLQYRSGSLSGTVEVADPTAFGELLLALYAALSGVLGGDADRVVFYLVGRTPAGATVGPADVGLPERPSGRDVARKSTLEGPGQQA
jgi:hypothetical protein